VSKKRSRIPKCRVPSLRFLRQVTDPAHPLYVSQNAIIEEHMGRRRRGEAAKDDDFDLPLMTLNDAIRGVTKTPNPQVVASACSAAYIIIDRREAAMKELDK